MGASEHNDVLKGKVNNIKPHWDLLLTPHPPTHASSSYAVNRSFRPAQFVSFISRSACRTTPCHAKETGLAKYLSEISKRLLSGNNTLNTLLLLKGFIKANYYTIIKKAIVFQQC